jgi:hypothetical protein
MTPDKGPAPDPREENLPLYAQKLLEGYRRSIERWEAYAIAARLETKPSETDTIMSQYSDHEIGLPRGETITFRQPTSALHGREEYVDARMGRDGWTQVSCGGRLEIHAEATNCIRVRQVPHVQR